MRTLHDSQDSQDVVLDIDAELRHWRGCYRQSAFHRGPREFDDYIPTLKFGYDTYLLNYHRELDAVLGVLKARYERDVAEWQRLDWPLGEAVIRETWKRMRTGKSWRRLQTPSRGMAHQSAAAVALR
jgi:hypothetical protein